MTIDTWHFEKNIGTTSQDFHKLLPGVTLAAIAPELSLELLMPAFRQLDSPGGCGGQRRAAWFS